MNDIEEKRRELVAIASAMIAGREDLIEGARQIVRLAHDIGVQDDAVVIPFRGVESETDHFPIGVVREVYAAEFLKRLDAEKDQFLDEARDDILTFCRKLIAAYTNGADA